MHKYPLPGTIANSILPLGLELTPGQGQEPKTHPLHHLRPLSIPKMPLNLEKPSKNPQNLEKTQKITKGRKTVKNYPPRALS